MRRALLVNAEYKIQLLDRVADLGPSIEQNGPAMAKGPTGKSPTAAETPPYVLVRIEYAALNFRDYIIGSGRYGAPPHDYVAGNEGAGVVLDSTAPDFRPGDAVFVNGHGLGEKRPGTMSGQVRLPPEAVIHLPDAMTTLQAATVGVAALVTFAADRVFGPGPVAVTGAMGGTGRVAAACFARAGRDVTALTRDPARATPLTELGIGTILPPPTETERTAEGFGPESYAAAVDVTGDMLNWLTRQMRTGGVIALAGFAATNRPDLSALAVILRNLRLIGVNSGLAPSDKAQALHWVAATLHPGDYPLLAHPADPQDIAPLMRDFAGARGRGRIVVTLQ